MDIDIDIDMDSLSLVKRKQGFTLLELSIVLVIIGLIIGGITVGADLIRSAELNSVISDFKKYQVVMNTFKLKYNAIPGDMKNATAYWGEAAATNCRDAAGTGTETCNGNGDGIIILTTESDERLRIWQHLANAELISGSYTGLLATSPIGIYVPDENVPATPLGYPSHWYLEYRYGNSASSSSFSRPAGHELRLSLNSLTPAECFIIDQKIDDGDPARGDVFVSKSSTTAAGIAPPGDANAEYDLTSSNSGVGVGFRILK